MLFGNLWKFCKWLLNQVDDTWLNSYPKIQKRDWAIIILVEEGVLNQNLRTIELWKKLEKIRGLQITIQVVTLNVEPFEELKKLNFLKINDKR
jgi:hypothetical protein